MSLTQILQDSADRLTQFRPARIAALEAGITWKQTEKTSTPCVAREFLPTDEACLNFVNGDLIAAGLSPFALQTTLSGLGYARQIPQWRVAGYAVALHFLALPDADMAIAWVAQRVRQGGHDIPVEVIGKSTQAMKSQRKVPDGRSLADFAPTIILKAKDFASEVTIFRAQNQARRIPS